jgi:hypothetical protein
MESQLTKLFLTKQVINMFKIPQHKINSNQIEAKRATALGAGTEGSSKWATK